MRGGQPSAHDSSGPGRHTLPRAAHLFLPRALDALEAARPDPVRLDMGVITAGVAMTWIGFRHPDFDLAAGRPRLVTLQAALEARPSFGATRPG